MCGHGTIGAVTAIIEEGLVTPAKQGTLAIDAPVGRIEVEYARNGQLVEYVLSRNVPSYLHASALSIDIPPIGTLSVDVAYGGNYYAIVEPQSNWPGLNQTAVAQHLALSPMVRFMTEKKLKPAHPADDRIRGASHVMWCDSPLSPRASARNAVFYGDKAIDRSPCGTGSSARMAQLTAKGRLSVGEEFIHESIIGTMFHCKVETETRVGSYAEIRPSVAGWARVTGHNTIFVDPSYPLAHGLLVL